MSSPSPAAELADAPAQDVGAVADTCRRRVLEREGIAMFVALHDARPDQELVVHDPLSQAEGARLAVLLEHYERELTQVGVDPRVTEAAARGDDGPDDVDTGLDAGTLALIEALVILSDQHLRARTELSA